MSNLFTICKGKAAFDSGEGISEHCQGGLRSRDHERLGMG